jgi:hypothetical protein
MGLGRIALAPANQTQAVSDSFLEGIRNEEDGPGMNREFRQPSLAAMHHDSKHSLAKVQCDGRDYRFWGGWPMEVLFRGC